MAICLFGMTFRIIKKLSVPTKRATVSLIKVKSCNALLRVRLVCIRSCLKSVLICKFLILVPIIQTLREQRREDPWLFFEAKRGTR